MEGGYDTHADQAAGMERLPQRPPDTLLAVSEFGRRLHENGSGGTDHSSASVALLLGDQWPDRLLGRYPSLSDLDESGALIASLSPPELYRQVLELVGFEGAGSPAGKDALAVWVVCQLNRCQNDKTGIDPCQ